LNKTCSVVLSFKERTENHHLRQNQAEVLIIVPDKLIETLRKKLKQR